MGFQFMALVRNEGANRSIYRLSLSEELCEEMERSFVISAGKWQEAEIQKTPFNQDYKLSDYEIFEIKKYMLPPDILNSMRFPHEYSEFDANAKGIADLKAIFAVGTYGGNITAIFKMIGKAKKIQPAKNLMLMCAGKSYEKQTNPGIIIDDRIAAVYQDGNLFFKSASTVKQILSLKDYMNEANDLEVVAFLESWFETDTDKILAVTDNWMRKRFSELKDSKIFETRNALDIYETARSFGAEIPIQLSKDRKKLVLPEQKSDIRMILKFLNEEYYKGELTGKVYQTAAKRALGKPENAPAGGVRKAELSFSR